MSDLSQEINTPTVPAAVYDEMKLVKLARELAMSMKDVEAILRDHDVSQSQFEALQGNHHFNKVFAAELAAWGAAGNTDERVKFKSAAMIEEILPECYARLNDPKEPMMAKVKMLELVGRWAGWGQADIKPAFAPGDRVLVQINLGNDSKLTYEKRLPYKVIDASPIVVDNSLQTGFDANKV